MKRTIAIVSAALLSVGVASAPAAFAQSASTQDSATQGAATQSGSSASSSSAPAQQQSVSDADLKSFVEASKQVAPLAQDYATRSKAAGKDNTKVKQIFDEDHGKMVKAIQDNGLTVERFNQIGESMQQDPQLLKRAQGIAQQK